MAQLARGMKQLFYAQVHCVKIAMPSFAVPPTEQPTHSSEYSTDRYFNLPRLHFLRFGQMQEQKPVLQLGGDFRLIRLLV